MTNIDNTVGLSSDQGQSENSVDNPFPHNLWVLIGFIEGRARISATEEEGEILNDIATQLRRIANGDGLETDFGLKLSGRGLEAYLDRRSLKGRIKAFLTGK